MANPNSAKNTSSKRAFRADDADAAAKAKAAAANPGERIGTAESPINEGAPSYGALGSNEVAKWTEELSANLERAAASLDRNTTARLVIWRDIGAYLNKFEDRFIVREVNAKGKWTVVKNADGKPKKDNNAYNAALLPLLKEKGYIITSPDGKDGGLLGNKNTRAAAKAVALNWEEIEKVPAVLKHGHPVHAMTAFQAFKKAMNAAAKAWKDGPDNFDSDAYAAAYSPTPTTAAGGASVPHSVQTFKIKIREWVKGVAPTKGIEHYAPSSSNEWKAWAELLAAEVSRLSSVNAELKAAVEEFQFTAAQNAERHAETTAKASKAKASRRKAKTESGDEVSEAEAAWRAESEGEHIDVEFTPVEGPSSQPLALPAPSSDDDNADQAI